MLPAAGLPIRLRPGLTGGHPRPAPLHGPGHPQDAIHDVRGFHGDREHRQPPRVAQAPRHADDHPRYRGNRFVPAEEPRYPAGCGCFRPGGSRGVCARLAHQVNLLPDVLLHLGRGRRFRAKAPRHQPEASSACPLCQGPLPAPGGPVPGPGGGLGSNGGDSLHPSERPRGPAPVQKAHKGAVGRRGLAVITSHPGIVAQAARVCQAPGLPPPRTLPPGRARAPMPRSGDLRASTPPLICSTGISWQSCQARATSCSPVRNYLAPATQAQTLPIPSTWLQTVERRGSTAAGAGKDLSRGAQHDHEGKISYARIFLS